jgi:hypothetical protein
MQVAKSDFVKHIIVVRRTQTENTNKLIVY